MHWAADTGKGAIRSIELKKSKTTATTALAIANFLFMLTFSFFLFTWSAVYVTGSPHNGSGPTKPEHQCTSESLTQPMLS